MHKVRYVFGVSVIILVAGVGTAAAEPITLNYNVTATDFGKIPPFLNPNAPVDPVTFTFSLAFDNAADLIDETAGLTLTNLNIALEFPPAFSYVRATDRLVIGGLPSQIGTGGADDFMLTIGSASGNPTPTNFGYSQRGASIFLTSSVLLSPAAAPVPEPTSLTLVGVGLAGMAARLWRHRN
jgi:hypothetical protein